MERVEQVYDSKAKVIRTAKAWDLIGWDDGPIRIKGGRALYEAVMYNCETGGRMVLLSKLDCVSARGIRQINRYVEPDTLIEILEHEKPEQL